FQEPSRGADAAEPVLDAIVERWPDLAAAAPGLRLAWHVGDRDLQPGQPGQRRLQVLCRLALETGRIEFVMDRPRRPISLAEGIDRKHPAVLLAVGLNLARLTGHAGVAGDAARFLVKLPSLARMAISAAVQKRQFLRRHVGAELGREFLLDRARLVVVPVGLEAAVRALSGHGACAGGPALDLAQQIVASLAANLRSESQRANIESCVDAAFAGADELNSFVLGGSL